MNYVRLTKLCLKTPSKCYKIDKKAKNGCIKKYLLHHDFNNFSCKNYCMI